MNNFPTLHLEGGLIAPDLVEQIAEGTLPGQKVTDYGFDSRCHLTDEIAAAWASARSSWDVFQNRISRKDINVSETSVTRDLWVIPLLNLFGYELTYQQRARAIDGDTYAVSHLAGKGEDDPPVHIVGYRQELDRRSETGRPRLAPHALVQEYLNRTESIWGIVTNGRIMRLLRDSGLLRRQSYIEFDLESMMEGEKFADFVVFYRLLHRSRFPKSGENYENCLLEKYHTLTIEQGGRVRDHLRDGVEKALITFANGFLQHPKNEHLRESYRSGALTAFAFYQELLRLIYRFLFLMVAEERNLITDNLIYRNYYSISHLRRLAEVNAAYTDHLDLWYGVVTTFSCFQVNELAEAMRVPVLNGNLFSSATAPSLEGLVLTNRDLLESVHNLSLYRENEKTPLRRINYSALDVEELGSVYESLLDFQPVIREREGVMEFTLFTGTERKSSGSYYTPPELVSELVKSALLPVIADRLKKATTKDEKAQAILSITVCDPACGSGHFLLAVARALGKELAKIRFDEDEPTPDHLRLSTRDCITHCIFGVDKNPLAVDLCKVALWIEGHTRRKPLTFLDHRIKCGDSLIGVFDLSVLKDGIPDNAYIPVSGDDKALASAYKKRNMSEKNSKQLTIPFGLSQDVHQLTEINRFFTDLPDDTPQNIRQKVQQYQKIHSTDSKWWTKNTAAHLWTAAFIAELTRENCDQSRIPTTADLERYQRNQSIDPRLIGYAWKLAGKHRFFHWPLEFPEVFEKGGFDVILCNPPWERIKLQEQEFFSTRDPEIAQAPNKAAREKLIKELPKTNPGLYNEYLDALHGAEAASKFLRKSERFSLTAHGDINTYSVFAELFSIIINHSGRSGVVVPTGIATDDTNKEFFAHLVETGKIASLYDFENRAGLFPSVDSRYKFSLLTVRGKSTQSTPHPVVMNQTNPVPFAKTSSPPKSNPSPSIGEGQDEGASPSQFAFFLTRTEQLKDTRRVFTLTKQDFELLNPNTRTCPIFRTRIDAELTSKIYQRVPVLINEKTGANPWGVTFKSMFHMSNDSHLFKTRFELEQMGFHIFGNRFVRGNEVWLPLYEAKMIWQFDHRFGTYEGVESRSNMQIKTPDIKDYENPKYLSLSWYWVKNNNIRNKLSIWQKKWLMGFRDIARSTDERSTIFCIFPLLAVGNSLPLIFINEVIFLILCFYINCCSLVFDYVVRQKLAGINLNFFYVQQLPVLPPESYILYDIQFIVPRVLELTYTAWDIKAFADDVWRDADENLRGILREQWEENKRMTGGHEWDPPEWAEIEEDGIPLPPFKWSEERRAILRAELDAYYARLYGLNERELRYILDPQDVYGSDFPGETFRVLKEKEIRQYGEYRTRRLVLEAWERLKM